VLPGFSSDLHLQMLSLLALHPSGLPDKSPSSLFSTIVTLVRVICLYVSRTTHNGGLLVPIYDGRAPEFDPLLDLDKLENLPLWIDDAPKNSLAAVGYTAHTYRTKAGQVHLSFNVQWLVVLGVSDVVDVEADFE
jgi:hypothetical protein